MKAKSINVNSLKKPAPSKQCLMHPNQTPKVGVVAVWNLGIENEDSEAM